MNQDDGTDCMEGISRFRKKTTTTTKKVHMSKLQYLVPNRTGTTPISTQKIK